MRLTKKQIFLFTKNDNFELLMPVIKKLPPASFLFVTYNRCPHNNFQNNPLTWAFQTLLANKFCQIDEFLVVDDNSTDYTKQNINWLKQKYNINIKYIKNKKHKEYSYSRLRGLKHVKNKLVFMGDDDCLYNLYFIAGSLITYYLLKHKFKIKNLAVINLPVYEKSIVPQKTIEAKKIGKILLKKTFFYHNFDKLPHDYLVSPKYLDKSKIILMPLKVDTFSGVNLCDRSLILKAGNYSDLSMWKNGYSEHIELSHRLLKNNFFIYHQPDPKVGCLHLKYGAKSKNKFDNLYRQSRFIGLKYKLSKLVKASLKQNFNTGARCDNYIFHFVEIGTLFSFYLKISKKIGIKFAKKEYCNFVEKGLVFSTTTSSIVKSKEKRREIWLKAIKMGCLATQKQTGKNYSDIYKKIINDLKIYKKI